MRSALLLAILFAVMIVLETSVLWALGNGAQTIPLMTIAGILVMHKSGIADGIAWFFALAVLQGDSVSFALCIIAPFFLMRIFSTRSVYALIGFGVVSYTSAMVSIAIITYVGSSLSLWEWNGVGDHALSRVVFLIPGLYIGTLIIRSVQQNIISRVALKDSL